MKDYFNAVNEDVTASQQFYVVLEEGVTDTKRAEQILRKNRGGFVKDSNGFPVIVGGKSGGYLAFGPPEAAFEVSKAAAWVDAWTPELSLDASFDVVDAVIEVETERAKTSEGTEEAKGETWGSEKRLKSLFKEIGLETRENRIGESVNSLRVDVTRLGNAKDDEVFAKYASEEVIAILIEKGINVLVDDESYELGPNVTMGAKHSRRNVVFDPDGGFFNLRNIPTTQLADAARFIAALPFIVRVAPMYARKTSNRNAKGIIQGSIWKSGITTMVATPIWSKGNLLGIQSLLVLAILERIETVAISRGITSLNIILQSMETERTKMVMARMWLLQSRDTRPLIPQFTTAWQPQPKLHFLILPTQMSLEILS